MTFFGKLFGGNGNDKINLSLLLNNEIFKNFILKTDDVSIGYNEINFFKLEDIENAQIGYSISENGKSLIGNKNGDWKKNWVVIATDNLGDPIFVDYVDNKLSVYTSQDGQGEWEETKIATSFTNFIEVINDLQKLSIGRENPVKIEQNPITEKELENFIQKIENKNVDAEIWFWEGFLENDDE
jgi:hypothetical protein